MGTAPRSIVDDFRLPGGRELGQELAVVGQPRELLVFDKAQGIGKSHLSVAMMVAITLAIGGHMHHLRIGVAGVKATRQAPGKIFAVVENSFKGDRAGMGAVVEENGNASSLLQPNQVGMVGMDGGIGSLGPARDGAVQSVENGLQGGFRALANPGALVGRKNREQDAILRQQIQRFDIHRGFRKPHAFGLASEAMLEVGNAPADLRHPVARIGQGHDDVVVDLGHGRAMAAIAQHALPVGIADHAIGARRIFFQPGEQGRPEVEADARVVVHDADDLVLAIDDARGAIGRIAFRRDALVPIVVGCRRIFGLHRFEPGVFSRRLIKMAVNAEVAFRGGN